MFYFNKHNILHHFKTAILIDLNFLFEPFKCNKISSEKENQ